MWVYLSLENIPLRMLYRFCFVFNFVTVLAVDTNVCNDFILFSILSKLINIKNGRWNYDFYFN